MEPLVLPFEKLRMNDVDKVGGKNSSLGEMISQLADTGVRVPGGFATTAQAYRDFLAQSGLDNKINAVLDALDVDDVNALVKAGAEIRQWIMETPFPMELTIAITEQYQRLVADSTTDMSFAVRSSATAEDLPDASFAGQQETFLNIVGLENILHAIKEVFASLYNDRAISYRVHKGFVHADVALSAGIQRMVRSDKGAAGVMFTLDTESGFRDAVFVTSSYGLGETVVQGAVNPDEFYVHKPMLEAGKHAVVRRNLGSKMIKMTFSAEKVAGKSVVTEEVEESLRHQFSLNDAEVMELARYAQIIEKHYGRPMDIEWGKDGIDGKLYILQARPETVQSQAGAGKVEKFKLKSFSKVLASGRAIGQKIGVGPVRIVKDPKEMDQVRPGDVLVADMTDPNWEPVMKRASAIVTNRGGRTCHAAIIARELGIPAIVRNVNDDPSFEPWRTAVQELGFRATIALPLRVDGRITGVLNLYSATVDPFDDEEITLLCNLAAELDLGLSMQRSRQTLAQNEAMLLEAQRLARLGHFTFDTGSDCLTGSPTHNEIFGLAPDEHLNTEGWRQLIHPEDRTRMSDYSREHVFRGGQPFDNEYRLIRRNDSQERWIHTVGQLVYGNDGRVNRLFGTSQDITERKQFEQRLSQSEADLKEAQAVAHLGSWTLDIIHDRLNWSAEVYRIFGLPLAHKLRLADFVERIHPDDREHVLTDWQAALTGARYDSEHRILVDQQVRWVRERAKIRFDDAGKAVSAVGTVQDVTERHETDEKLRKLSLAIEQSPHSILITNMHGEIEYINEAFACKTGYSREEVIGQKPSLLHSDHTPAETYSDLWKTLALGNVWRGEFTNRRRT